MLQEKELPSTGTVDYTYDALQRLASIDYSDTSTPDVTYSYDGDNDRTKMVDGIGTSSGITYTYDNLSNMLSAVRHYSGGNQEFDYTYYPGSQQRIIHERLLKRALRRDDVYV